MKKISLGVLAHVDAGKTTLCEAMLYYGGALRKAGRVDTRDTFLDTHSIERARGITVFSKLALLSLENTELTIVDTPGHVDFSCEAERSLSIQDYAILIVSASDGPTPHTVTLFNLLSQRKIPTFIFVNKTDIAGRRRIDLLAELKRAFGQSVCDFNLESEDKARFFEECAGCDEKLMASYFERGELCDGELAEAIRGRRLIPAIFGSALKGISIDTLLSAIDRYTIAKRYSESIFGARIFKISTDPSGARLTWVKITGGTLLPKQQIGYVGKNGKRYDEKIESIRKYSSDNYKAVRSAGAGDVVALLGLSHTSAGDGLGIEPTDITVFSPVLDYKLSFKNPDTDTYLAYLKLAAITEEEPMLNIRYDHNLKEIKVSLMGEIQAEVLTELVKARLGLDITLSEGTILYKETVCEECFGAGHFEPLMHYAEVRLKLTPLPEGSGLVFTGECSEDKLKRGWQRLIITHLGERIYKGVLIGAPITDMKISVVGGRAHPKHTEGGDFREATARALRSALMKSRSRLLEPTFNFTLEVPAEHVGKALTDINNMHGECDGPEFLENGRAVIRGSCPVYTMRYYSNQVRSYTSGKGTLTLTVGDYMPCHNEEQIIAESGYSCELDSDITADSIFCKGGVGYTVPWYEAEALMHTDSPVSEKPQEAAGNTTPARAASKSRYRGTAEEDRVLMQIFEATYGKIKPRVVADRVENSAPDEAPKRKKPKPRGDDYLIIDGYNLIFAWDELRELAEAELSHARDTLIRLMCDYRAFKKVNLIIVFDAYRRKGGEGSVEELGGITVVYTKERQTADAYIEKSTYSLAEKNSVRVVTSDYEEQLVVLGNGAIRVSAREFVEEFRAMRGEISGIIGD